MLLIDSRCIRLLPDRANLCELVDYKRGSNRAHIVRQHGYIDYFLASASFYPRIVNDCINDIDTNSLFTYETIVARY